jgi:hypothetical protein
MDQHAACLLHPVPNMLLVSLFEGRDEIGTEQDDSFTGCIDRGDVKIIEQIRKFPHHTSTFFESCRKVIRV